MTEIKLPGGKKNMEVCPNVVLAQILEFGSLDDMFNIRTLSSQFKRQFNGVVEHLRPKKMFERRLKQKISKVGIDVDRFMEVVKENDAVVTGSIHIETLLGKPAFKSGDMDIFVYRKDWATISPVVHYISQLQQRDGWQFTRPEEQNSCQLMKYFYTDGEQRVFCQDADMRIKNVSTFTFLDSDFIIQVVELYNVRQFSDAVYTPISMDDYVIDSFDFRCCTSTYDGVNYKWRFLNDMHNRALVLNGDFSEKAMMFSQQKTTSHKKRVRKYLTRGFTPHDCNLKPMPSLGLEYGVIQAMSEQLNECKEFWFQQWAPLHNMASSSPIKVFQLLKDKVDTRKFSMRQLVTMICKQYHCTVPELERTFYRKNPRRSVRLLHKKKKTIGVKHEFHICARGTDGGMFIKQDELSALFNEHCQATTNECSPLVLLRGFPDMRTSKTNSPSSPYGVQVTPFAPSFVHSIIASS